MVPQAIVVLEDLPLTPNGKVNRAALPAPEPERQQERPLAAPRSPLESALVEIWEEVLDVHPIGVADDFFELGGHSLLAFRMISRVRSAFDVDVFLRTVFEHSTIEQLADVLTQQFLADETGSDLAALLSEVEAAGDGVTR
jgi:acyl carrier protein